MNKYFNILFGLLALVLVASCGKHKNEQSATDTIPPFPITRYGLYEWNNYTGMAFPILKTVRKDDGRLDSSYTNSDSINWGPLFTAFFETDISDPKFAGKYKYSHFPDDQDNSYNYFWEAIDDDLFTRKLLVTYVHNTDQIKGIYVETLKTKFLKGEVIRKLYYQPYRTIQITTDETSTFGRKSLTVEQYDFMIQ